jgi:hypothetical protein
MMGSGMVPEKSVIFNQLTRFIDGGKLKTLCLTN